MFSVPLVATALTVYGIETKILRMLEILKQVATALTVYGIETTNNSLSWIAPSKLQQHLPFTVLKRTNKELKFILNFNVATALTVYGIETGRCGCIWQRLCIYQVATALTVYGIETHVQTQIPLQSSFVCCNSTYRLRY